MQSEGTASGWPRVLVAVAAGFALAFQVGKVPAALPLLSEELRLSLHGASWIVAIFSVMSALIGVFAGRIAQRAGSARAAIAGLLVCVVGGIVGAEASALTGLLVGRVIEGLGFIVAVTALPSLVAAHASTSSRPLALGLWGAFLPGGMSLMLLASPVCLALLGWRGLWQLTSVLLLLAAGLLWCTFRHEIRLVPAAPAGDSVARIVFRRGPLLLAACFGAYSAQFIAVTSFLPTLLISDYGASVSLAATIGAAVVAANVAGNVAAGWLLRGGIAGRKIMMFASLMMALAAIALFSNALPAALRVMAAVGFSAVGGLLPGTLFASTPGYATQLAQVAVLSGLLLQVSGFGQVVGPPLLSLTVEQLGSWSYAPVFTVSAALLGVVFASLLPARGSDGTSGMSLIRKGR